MEALFLKIVNMSLTASWLVLAIIAVRLVFKKTPKWIICLLWGLVAFRLIFPFSIESTLSLIPTAEPLPQEIIYTARPEIQSGVPVIDNTVNPILESSLTPSELTSVNPTQVWSFVLSQVWIFGMVLMLLYTVVSYLMLKRKVSTAIPMAKGIKCSEYVDSPFVLGLIRPVIYLPFGMEEADIAYVLAHEKAHISRRDHWWKPLGFILLSIYWFNPVLWVAYILLCRDIEAACDEKVIRDMNRAERRAYSTALLNCSIHRRRIAACPLAFGETGVKNRVRNIMHYKKPAVCVVLITLAVSAVVAACFLTDPKEEQSLDDKTGVTGHATLEVGNSESTEDGQVSRDGNLKFILPDGLDFSRDIQGNLIFTDGLNMVGGKCVYKIPDGYEPDEYFSQEFLVALGIPEASNETLGFFGGGSVLGPEGYGMEYFSDVPPGQTREIHTHHQFFVMDDGETVYDIWLDLRFVDSAVKDSILGSVEIPEMEPAPTVEEQANTATQESQAVQWNQQDALAQCRAVLDQVRNSAAYKIDTMQENGASSLNEMSMITDWANGENRLNISYIPENGGMSVVGGMVMDGQRYSYDLVQQWRSSSHYDWEDPWLVSFRWDDAIVAYMDTLTEENGTTVLLRIDEPYEEGADQQPCYFVNFNFEPDGSFRNVYVQINLFTDNAVYKTESVLNLNAEVIQKEIQAEFNSITQ